MLPLFEPLWDAILAHQNTVELHHADETGWRIQALQEICKSRRAWLWTSVSHDAVLFHIDRTRSAAAAEKLFAGTVGPVYLVCDRYSSYNWPICCARGARAGLEGDKRGDHGRRRTVGRIERGGEPVRSPPAVIGPAARAAALDREG